MRKRMFFMLLTMMLGLLLWEARILWLQTVGGHDGTNPSASLVEQSVRQRMVSFELDDGRARFFDRNGQSLGGEERRVLVVFPKYKRDLQTATNREKMSRSDERVRQILQADKRDWHTFIDGLKAEARVWQGAQAPFPQGLTVQQAEHLNALQVPGLAVANHYVRRTEQSVGQALIGTVGENARFFQRIYATSGAGLNMPLIPKLGVSGLERSMESKTRGYDGEIAPVGARSITWLEPNGELRLIDQSSRHYPLRVVTTIDRALQARVEQAMAQMAVREGAVVVLDRRTADVLVMASRSRDGHNQALLEAKPGSIFKIAVAAAAVGTRAIGEESHFQCNGSYGKYRFVCWRRAGHGHISAAQAFAFSCNIAFAEMAKRLSPQIIERYAQYLGLAQQVGWSSSDDARFRQLPEEQPGMIFANRTNMSDEGALIQTAIGQRDVLVSPLQAANMVATILNNGRLQAPRTVREIRYKNGQVRETFHEQVLRPADAEFRRIAPLLRQWMRETVRSGTAKALLRSPHTLAGKTGTAQVKAGQGASQAEAVHQWFVGYDAADERFAVAVLVKHVHPHARQLALPLAARVFDILLSAPLEQAP